MATRSRVAKVRFNGAASAFREFLATADVQDTAAGSSVTVTVTQTSGGATPPGTPDFFQLAFRNNAGAVILAATLNNTAASQSQTFHFTDSGLSGGAFRAGIVEVSLRAQKTTGGPTATYDYSSNSFQTTPPAGFTPDLDRGYIRGTTTATTVLNRSAFYYPDTITATTTLGAAPYVSRQVSVKLGSRTAVLSAASTSTVFTTALGTTDNTFPAAVTSISTVTTFPNDSFAEIPWTAVVTTTPDSGPSSRTGTLTGTVLPSLVTSPFSGHGSALSFDGVNRGEGTSGVNMGTTSGLTVQGVGAAAAFTLEAKVRTGAIVAATYAIAGRYVSSSGVGKSQPELFLSAAGKASISVRDNTGVFRQIVGATTITASTDYTLAASYDGTTMRLFVNGALDGSLALSGVEAPDATTRFLIGRIDDAGSFPFLGTIDEVRLSNTARYTATYTPATTPLTSDANTLGLWHLDSVNGVVDATSTFDPRGFRIPLFQLDDNTYGTPPLSKDKPAHSRKSTQGGYLASRTVNGRGEGLNGITYNVSLTSRRPGGLVSQTGLITATRGGQDGWAPDFLPWTIGLPGGVWDKAFTVTAPANITGAGYVVQQAGTSTEYTLLARDDNLQPRVNVNHEAALAGRHFEAGMKITVVGYVLDSSIQMRISGFSSVKCTLTRAKPTDSNGLSNTFQFFNGTDWIDWTSGVAQTTFDMTASPVDAQTFERQFTTDAAWGLRDFRANVQFTYDGITYTDSLVVPNVDTKNRHDGYVFDGAGFVGFPSK